MDRSLRLVNVASDVRWCWNRLAKAAEGADEAGARELALKMFDLELQLVELHSDLIELASQPARPPRCEQRHRRFDDELPF